MAGKPCSPALRAEITATLAETGSIAETARRLGIDRATVKKYAARVESAEGPCCDEPPPVLYARVEPVPHFPAPAPEAGGPALPDPVNLSHDPYTVDGPGTWLVLGDTHIPYHDRRTIELAVDEARRRGVAGVLLNGDLMDCYQLSRHYREPNKGRFADGVECGKQFLAWLRSRFPAQRIVFKLGNHDEWLRRYLAERAPEVFGLEGFDLESVLRVKDYGVEVVGDKRAVHLGRLPVFHGHEFRGGGGVNPARWLFLRIVTTGMVSHFHRSSQHDEASYDGRVHGTWSVGCACYLYPEYDPNCKWNHGYAFVTVAQGGHFEVTNRRLLRDGRVV